VPAPHQVRADVLAGPHQIPGGFIRVTRNPHRRDLSQQGQPGQMLGVAGIGLYPVPGRPLKLRGCRDQTLSPCIQQ
jgi:hypothetical protein